MGHDAHHQYDVVVVGARLAGAATAMLLARGGARVALVDRSRPGTDTMSTHALMRVGVLQLHRWGLLDEVRAAGTPPVHRTTFTYRDAVVPITIKPSEGVDALYAPRRTVLDPVVASAAAAAGAVTHYGVTVDDVLRDARGRITGVTGFDRDGHAVSLEGRWVVGADGLRSAIAAKVGAPVTHQGRHMSALTYGHWHGADVEGYEWVFQNDACAGAVRTNYDDVCVYASATPGTIGKGGIDVIEDVLRRTAPDLFERVRVGAAPSRTYTFRGHRGFLKRPWGDGWALVGDAAYFKDPLTAHGMTDALRDAELLSRALLEALAGADERQALRHYQAVRDQLSLPLFRLTDTIASQRWRDDEIGDLLLELSRSMADELAWLSSLDGDVLAATGGAS